jgi:hypothetical protein
MSESERSQLFQLGISFDEFCTNRKQLLRSLSGAMIMIIELHIIADMTFYYDYRMVIAEFSHV